MGDIGRTSARYEVLPTGPHYLAERVLEADAAAKAAATDGSPAEAGTPARSTAAFPSGRRDNWLRRTARAAR